MLFNTEIDICSKIIRSRTFCKINNVKNKISIYIITFNH